MARRHNNGGAVGWGNRNGLGGGGNRRNDNSWLPGWAGQIQQQDRNPGGGGGGHHPHQGAGSTPNGGTTNNNQNGVQDFLNAQLKAQQDKYNQSAIDDLTNLFDTYGLGSPPPCKVAPTLHDHARTVPSGSEELLPSKLIGWPALGPVGGLLGVNVNAAVGA